MYDTAVVRLVWFHSVYICVSCIVCNINPTFKSLQLHDWHLELQYLFGITIWIQITMYSSLAARHLVWCIHRFIFHISIHVACAWPCWIKTQFLSLVWPDLFGSRTLVILVFIFPPTQSSQKMNNFYALRYPLLR